MPYWYNRSLGQHRQDGLQNHGDFWQAILWILWMNNWNEYVYNKFSVIVLFHWKTLKSLFLSLQLFPCEPVMGLIVHVAFHVIFEWVLISESKNSLKLIWISSYSTIWITACSNNSFRYWQFLEYPLEYWKNISPMSLYLIITLVQDFI